MSENNGKEINLFRAYLKDNQIFTEVNTNHLPMLAFAVKMLEIKMEQRLVESLIKKEAGNQSQIIVPETSLQKAIKIPSIIDEIRNAGKG